MKHTLLLLLATALLFGSNAPALAADTNSAASAELKTLVTTIQTKLREGKKTEADLADDIKQFDTLLAEHKGEKTDDVANILYMKAKLYAEVFENQAKSDALYQQLRTDFPDSAPAKMLKAQEAAKKIQASLVEGAAFPGFDEKDVASKPLSVAGYKGKVLLVDFWATWCGPCVHELPNVRKTYEKHHGQGFEIIGVSLDQSESKLKNFTRDQNMPWQQYFDGKGWGNKLAQKYGIESIPATFLLDAQGKIIGRDLRGEELEAAVAKAVAKL